MKRKVSYSISIACLFSLIFILCTPTAKAMKGRLLLVGGGSEQIGGWSNPAYKWAVDKSENKRVAIIGYSAPTSFLRDYFKNNLGANFSKDFTVATRNEALAQSIYDSLITYDVIFFRGGDQSIYYTNFKDTKLSDAVKFVFNKGGVIAGTSAGLHILSSVIYSAADASITPEQAMLNVNSSDITLENDFLGLFPGFIFDSHVAERGRFPRSISFLARWFKDKGEKIKAVAMDDLTAMGIDTNEVGEVLGTGAAGIYQTSKKNGKDFSLSRNGKLAADSIIVRNIINGWKYNFKTDVVIKPTTSGIGISNPTIKNQNISSKILLSSSDAVGLNKVLINQLVNNTSSKNDRIIIVTGSDSTSAFAFKTEMQNAGATRINIIQTSSVDTLQLKFIKNATKFLFVGNTLATLNAFFIDPNIGSKVYEIIKSNGSILAFVGGNSRFAGSRVLSENYTGQYTAYGNLITTSKGLDILKSTIVFPGSLSSANSKENSVCSVPFFMMKDTLSYGIMLNGDAILKYEVKTNGKAYFTSYGLYSAIILRNTGTSYSFSNTTSRNNGSQKPRQVAGFDSLYVSFVDSTNAKEVGSGITYKATVDTLSLITKTTSIDFEDAKFTIYPNPTHHTITMKVSDNFNKIENVTLIDISGKKVYESNQLSNQISVKGLPEGMYILMINDGENVYQRKVMIENKE